MPDTLPRGFSAVLISSKFDSGFYLHGPSHRVPKFLNTLFTTLFDWWAADWKVWLDNVAIIGNNIGDANQVTVAQLLGCEESVEEEGELMDRSRLPQ